MLQRFTTLNVLLVSLLMLSMSARADFARDFEQPIQVEADYQELNSRTNRLLYRDNVVIRQGTLLITAQQLEVQSLTDQIGEGEVFIATGEPASYQQEVEDDMVVHARANEIRYDSGSGILTLRGNSELEQRGNLVRASQITYFVEEQRVTAERSDDTEDRVITIFNPRRTQTETENNGNP